MCPIQLDRRQVQRAAPQAVQLQVGVQAFEGQLLLAGLADVQAPQADFQAERIELQTLQLGGQGGVARQLLVGDTQADPGEDQEAEQAVEGNGNQQGARGAFHSFVHGEASSIPARNALEYGTCAQFRTSAMPRFQA
ncbi:hypothetical protein D3C84_903860 [compost metagenome]